MSVAGRTILIICIALLALAGIAVAAARSAGSASAAAWLLAVPAAAAGSGAFFVLQKLARKPSVRDSIFGRAGWLFIAGLLVVTLLARLPAGWDVVPLAAAAGYLATTLTVISVRLLRVRAARRPA